MRRAVAIAIDGGGAELRSSVEQALRSTPDLELLPPGATRNADVALVAGDGERAVLDRARALGRLIPCVVLTDDAASVDGVVAAMAAGARGVVERDPLDVFALVGAIRTAAGFAQGRAGALDQRRGMVVLVTGGAGGAGTSTIAYALARAAGEDVALLDLDLLGGVQASLAGIALDAASAGLAGASSGRRAWETLAVRVAWGQVLVAPRRPDLAALVRDGVCGEAVRSARAAAPAVVVDAGRLAGAPAELLAEADAVVVATRVGRVALARAAEHAALVRRLVADRCPVRICASGVRPHQHALMRALAAVTGVHLDAVLPVLADVSRDAATRRVVRRLRPLLPEVA